MLADFPPSVQAEIRRILDGAARRLLDESESHPNQLATPTALEVQRAAFSDQGAASA